MGIVKKFKVGDIVNLKNVNNIKFTILEINESKIDSDDEFRCIVGINSEEDFYDRIYATISSYNTISTNIFRYPLIKLIKNEYKENNDMNLNSTKAKLNINNPTIIDYKVIDNKVVIVTFDDNTTEKAVVVGNDTFDFERAVEIYVLKKMLGGTKAYNDIRKEAMRQVKLVDKKKKDEAEEAERIANRKAKYAERQAKRKEKRRQEQINIQAEAFLKAMKMYDEEGVDQNKAAFDAEMDRLSYIDYPFSDYLPEDNANNKTTETN